MLAAVLFKLARCTRCGTLYNGKTGKDESRAWIYFFLVPLLFLAGVMMIVEWVDLF
jgi:hypothetical protein